MRALLRVAIVLLSAALGLLSALVVVRWIPGAPLGGGRYDATPVHVAGFFGMWILVTLVAGVFGNCVFSWRLPADRQRAGSLLAR